MSRAVPIRIHADTEKETGREEFEGRLTLPTPTLYRFTPKWAIDEERHVSVRCGSRSVAVQTDE